MNASTLQRLGFLFTLLCLTAVAVHPGAAAAAPDKDDHAPASAPAAPTDDSFDDDSDRDSSDWRSRIEAHHRRNRQHHEDGDIVSIGHSGHLESGQRADSVVSVFGSSTNDGEAVDVV